MKIIAFHIFKMIRLVYCLKQLIHQRRKRYHRSARIKKKKKLYGIFPRLFHHYLQTSSVITRLIDRSRDIQLRFRDIQLRRKLPQSSECQLKLPVIQHPVVPEIPVLARSDNRKSRLVACFSAYAHALPRFRPYFQRKSFPSVPIQKLPPLCSLS